MMLKTLLKKSTASTQAAHLVLASPFRFPSVSAPSRFFTTTTSDDAKIPAASEDSSKKGPF